MDFNLPEEIQILRETVRRFVDKELIPLEREYRHDSEGPMPEHLLKPLQEKTKAMGLWMLDVPAEYGGAGLGLLPRCIIHEEIARAASLPFRSLELFGPEVRPVLFHCNDEQKETISRAGAARRAEILLRPDRTRRRQRSGEHAHARGAATATISLSTAPSDSSPPRDAPTTRS